MSLVENLPGMNGKTRKLPSLEDLCVQSAIDNLHYLGDVGYTDLSLLQKILPHCTAEQLHRIESSSKGRDLSSITDELWYKFYARNFGAENVNLVLERMKKRHVTFKWGLLYQAKLREQKEKQKKGLDRLKQLYVEANNLKQSRQIQMCSKVPPTKKRRSDAGGATANRFVNGKGSLMKKLRSEFAERNGLMNAKVGHGPSPSKADCLQSRSSTLPYSQKLFPHSQKLSKPPQHIQPLQKVAKHHIFETNLGCKMSNSKNVLPNKISPTSSKLASGQICKR